MKSILKLTGALAVVAILGFWVSFGIFQDSESSTFYLFQKHKLTFKFYFSSPIGERDLNLKDLSPSQQESEKDFNEYVFAHKRPKPPE